MGGPSQALATPRKRAAIGRGHGGGRAAMRAACVPAEKNPACRLSRKKRLSAPQRSTFCERVVVREVIAPPDRNSPAEGKCKWGTPPGPLALPFAFTIAIHIYVLQNRLYAGPFFNLHREY